MTSGGRRVLVVVGTRPEAIKMAPVLRALAPLAPGIETRLLLTGQHSTLVDEALVTFGLIPDWNLGIMREGQALAEVGRACLAEVDRVLEEWTPELLLVQGDTATAFFAALTAYLRGIALGHVEAGLRTGDLGRPFPEEGFRRMVADLAALHFAPTAESRANLLREGVPEDRIHLTGNTVVDALLEVAGRGTPVASPALQRLTAPDAPPFLLLTAHRRESFGAPLERIFGAVRQLIEEADGLELVYPVHPNPAVTGPARRMLGAHPRIHLVEPLSYPDLVAALRGAKGILTDSGGIQEEAPTFGTPVLVLREVSERPEGIAAGVARIVGTDPDRILTEGRALLAQGPEERERRRGVNPYGDGRAGERIADAVAQFFASGVGAGVG